MKENNFIIINETKFEVGKKYVVHSPLDSPYIFMDEDIRQKRGIPARKIPIYIGTLVQIPTIEGDIIKGYCLYFKVDDINYHEGYEQAESILMIQKGIVNIVPYLE